MTWSLFVTGPLWISAVVLVLAVTAELGARWWIRYRRAYYVMPPGLRIRLHPDRKLLSDLEPVVRFQVNSDGERGGEVPRSVDGLYRVLVAGGSQPEGYLLDQNTTWPGALQGLLERPEHLLQLGASRVHVGCIARSGVGSEALDLILARVLPRYSRLQAIIILVGASDVLQWLEQGAPASWQSRVRPSDVFRCHPEGPFSSRALASVELLLRMRRRWLRPVQVHEGACRWVGDAMAMRARAKTIRTAMPDPTVMLDHFELYFRKALQKAKAHADRVLVVRQSWFDKDHTPEEAARMWHGGVGQAWRESVTTYYSVEVTSRLMALMDSRAARVAEELDVEQLDLMPILERSLRTYYDFFHLTPAGARTVAAAVCASVLRHPLAHASGSDRADEWTLAS
jgi:lysophospholipase L1-like esterase